MSRPRFLASMMATLALAGGMTASAAAHSQSSASAGTPPRSHHATAGVFVAARACTGHVRRPRKIVLACADASLYASAIKWRSYGGKVSSGKALLHLNECSPNCVSGHYRTFRSPIRLKRIVRCSDGRRYYTRAMFEGLLSGRRWSTEFIKPPLRCHLTR